MKQLSCGGSHWYLSISLILNYVEINISPFESRSYMTGVTAAAVTPVRYECDSQQEGTVSIILINGENLQSGEIGLV